MTQHMETTGKAYVLEWAWKILNTDGELQEWTFRNSDPRKIEVDIWMPRKVGRVKVPPLGPMKENAEAESSVNPGKCNFLSYTKQDKGW